MTVVRIHESGVRKIKNLELTTPNWPPRYGVHGTPAKDDLELKCRSDRTPAELRGL